jgi:urease accessory protein
MSAFVGGLLHPLAVPAHAMALLALGMLIGQQSLTRSPAPPLVAFAAGLASGLAAIASAVAQTSAGDLLLAGAVLCGLLVAIAYPLPVLVCVLLAVGVGAALGLDSPPAVISMAAATTMLIGTGLGAMLTLIIVALCARRLARLPQIVPRTGMRIVGSWVAASALLVLALRLARGQLF